MRSLLPALLIVSLSTLACARHPVADAPAGAEVSGDLVVFPKNSPAVASLGVAIAKRASWARARTTGRLSWDENVTARVYSPVTGHVQRILADVKKAVRKDEPLALIDSPDFGQAQADANRAATDVAAAEVSVERNRALYERGAAPKKELDAAEAEIKRSRLEAERTERRLALLGGTLGVVDQHYGLRSPIAGEVVERAINPGQEVRSDSQTPLYTVSDPSRLWLFLDITENDLPLVAKGMDLTVRTPAYPDRVFRGRIDVVGDSMDPATRTVKARGSIDNRDELLKAEMYVAVEIADPAEHANIEVPSGAIVVDGDRRLVFVVDGEGKFRRQPVEAGRERSGMTQVLSGLADGQHVVVEGALLLQSLVAAKG